MSGFTWALLWKGRQVGGDTDFDAAGPVAEFATALARLPRPMPVDEVLVWPADGDLDAEPFRVRRRVRGRVLAVAS